MRASPQKISRSGKEPPVGEMDRGIDMANLARAPASCVAGQKYPQQHRPVELSYADG